MIRLREVKLVEVEYLVFVEVHDDALGGWIGQEALPTLLARRQKTKEHVRTGHIHPRQGTHLQS